MMEHVEPKLAHFIDAILTDARHEADGVYSEISKESDAALAAAKDDALAEAYRRIKSEISQIKAGCGKRISRAVMENKRAQFLRREEMADEVTAEVRGKIAAYVRTPAYAEHLKRLVSDILCVFRADTTVYLRPEDMPLADRLAPPVYNVTFAEGSFSLGGLEAACDKLHVDETFDTKIDELRGHFAELFGLSLGL